jgi:agmatine/peptidylarginine deiminase
MPGLSCNAHIPFCGRRLQVYLATHPDDVEGAKAAVGEAAEIVPMVNGDSWMRDSGPTFVKNRQTGEVLDGAGRCLLLLCRSL